MDFYPVLKYFQYSHLPEKLQIVSKKFYDLAYETIYNERVVHPHREIEKCLNKLLEAKDCAVRSML